MVQQYAKDIHLYLENYREKENVQNADQKILKEKYQGYGIVQNAITKWQIYHMTQQQSNKNKFKFTAEITISSKNNSTAEKMLESIKPDLDKEDKIKVIKKDVVLSIQENDIAKLRAKISAHTRALDVTSQIIETL